jgi:cytochrome c oxidase assembly factor CtaG
MIALIALAAVALVIGVVVGTIALIVVIVVIVKGIVGATKRKTTTAPNARTAVADSTEREFQRMVAQEWPSD